MAKEIQYRPEIDGLRALAIAAVLLYHLGEVFLQRELLRGGFLGVDIFFVISGYLITSIIIVGLDGNTFSLADFYRRRIRRIIPVFMLVAFVSLPFVWLVLLPSETQAYAKSLIASLFFVSNFWFLGSDPYWSEGLTRPFLHTWSLAIEEQFYVIVPGFVLIVYRIARQWLLCLTTLLVIGSLIYAQYASGISADAAFYLLPSRLWELGAGSLLAIGRRDLRLQGLRDRFGKQAQWLLTLGFAMLIASLFLFSSSTRHPSLLTLFPIVGVLLVLSFSSTDHLVTRLLSLKPIVGLGLISYSLYLWHYPVYSFAQRLVDEPSVLQAALVTLLCLGLSIVSYFLVERPARHWGSHSFMRLSALLLLALVVLLGVLALIAKDGLRFRYPEFLLTQESIPVQPENYVWEQTVAAKKGNMVLVGDSHMMAIEPELRELALASGLDFATAVDRGCQFILGTRRVRQDNRQPTHCTESLQAQRLEFLRGAPASYVVIGGRLSLMLAERGFDNLEGGREKRLRHFLQNPQSNLGNKTERNNYIETQYRATVRKITELGHTVVLVYPIPEAGWHVPRKLIDVVGGDWLNARNQVEQAPITTGYEVFQQRNQQAYQLLDSIDANPIVRVYPESLFCNQTTMRCKTHDGEHVYYRDEHHPSAYASSIIASQIIDRLLPF